MESYLLQHKPAPTEIKFCSAIPTLKKRSGHSFLNVSVLVDFDKSASRTIILEFSYQFLLAHYRTLHVLLYPLLYPHDFIYECHTLFFTRCLTMPTSLTFHFCNTFTFYSMHYNTCRAICESFRIFNSLM